MAAIARRADDDLVAFLDIGNMRADGRHHTRRFVAGYQGKSHIPANALDGLVVRGADAAGLDPDDCLFRPGLRNRPFLQHKLIEIL